MRHLCSGFPPPGDRDAPRTVPAPGGPARDHVTRTDDPVRDSIVPVEDCSCCYYLALTSCSGRVRPVKPPVLLAGDERSRRLCRLR